ncbi:MAG: hypothetical protein OER43_07620 [Gammaproteobacteria bacterium]|nr:hypothetical protein [Gammaproteobacteria bacterium]MDH3411015.1 hypothetical protein [Gammaproteobacteria bacterium]
MITTRQREGQRIFSFSPCFLGTAFAALLAISPPPALAHAFGERYDLPIPLGLFLAGAGATILLTFLLLAMMLRTPPESARPAALNLSRGGICAKLAQRLGSVLRILSVLSFFFLCYAGFYGAQDTFKNIVPTLLWVGLWVGMAYLTALLGNPWRLINPYAVLFDWVEWAARAITGRPGLSLGLRYPPGLGTWPAAMGLLTLAWLELVPEGAERPAALALGMIFYGIYCLAGMVMFGRNEWLEHADVFTVAFGVLGRFAPLGHRQPERAADGGDGWVLRIPGTGLLSTRPVSFSLMVFVLLMLSNVTFDGFLETPVWNDMLGFVATSIVLRPFLLELQSFGFNLLGLIKTMGLIGFIGIFLGVYLLFGLLMSRAAGSGVRAIEMSRWFVLSLVPISIAYHLAHYVSFVALAGQLLIPLASDPLGRGWDLFGTAHVHLDVGVISARFVWYTALVTIVLGHMIAVILAHVQARRLLKDGRSVLMSQIPILVLMIGYTMSSLWILSQPVVKTQALG